MLNRGIRMKVAWETVAVALFSCMFCVGTIWAKENVTVGLAHAGFNIPYFAEWHKAWRKTADEIGVKTIDLDSNWSLTRQMDLIDDLLSKNVDVIVVVPTDEKAIIPALKKIHEAGVPLLVNNVAPDPEGFLYMDAYTGPDDEREGELMAELMAEALDGKGKITIVEGPPGYHANDYRRKGFLQRISEIAPQVEIIATQSTGWHKQEALTITETWLVKYGDDIDGVETYYDHLGMGVIEAIKDAGIPKGQIKVVGVGGGQGPLQAVKEGWMYGTVYQSAYEDAELALRAAVKLAKGEKVKKFVYMNTPKVTAENVDEFLPIAGPW